ncbi:WD40 repeat domain-containing serine/threonine protein kinase [Actinomadura rugatobispora]|uniref:non-specific serine/threonine protein kinase n=1 Tax=Actinomadura rugatobispora TaxID=1994 RepID=A0ABW1A8P5_9ACTN|nr:hypothetical protein GCM10010200_032460 [Actinomadura rugatobispora]
MPQDPHPVLRGRYSLAEPVGRGGMGAVWRAHDQVLHREVAVKEVLPPAGVPGADLTAWYARTMREARSAARLRHPSIITVHDVVWHDERPWIVMEFVAGRSLADELRPGPLEPARAAEIGGQVLAGLVAAHAAGVVHRDVKPANVLLDGGRVVITDFGIATAEGMTVLTASSAILGTPAYMAPEQVRSNAASPASDLWALGATLYAAVEGRPPFQGATPMAVLAALMTEEPEPPRRAGPLRPVLEGLLRKDPGQRMAAEEAARLLSAAAGTAAAPERPSAPAFVQGSEPTSLDDLPCSIDRLALSPDGSVLATAVPAAVDGGPAAWLWDVATGRRLLTVARSPGGTDDALAVFLADGRLIVGDGAVFSIVARGRAPQPVLDTDGRFTHVAVGCREDGRVLLATKSDVREGVLLHEAGGASVRVDCDNAEQTSGEMAFTGDGRVLAVAAAVHGSDEYQIELWETARNERFHVLTGQRENPWSLCFSPDGRLLLSWGHGGQPRLWDVRRRFRSPLVATLDGHRAPGESLAFSPDGTHAATVDGGELRLWSTDGGARPLGPLAGHAADVNAVAFGLGGKIAVTASDDATVRVWDVLAAAWEGPERAPITTLTGHSGPVRGLAVNRGGTVMATGGADGDRTVRLHDLSRLARA